MYLIWLKKQTCLPCSPGGPSSPGGPVSPVTPFLEIRAISPSSPGDPVSPLVKSKTDKQGSCGPSVVTSCAVCKPPFRLLSGIQVDGLHGSSAAGWLPQGRAIHAFCTPLPPCLTGPGAEWVLRERALVSVLSERGQAWKAPGLKCVFSSCKIWIAYSVLLFSIFPFLAALC